MMAYAVLSKKNDYLSGMKIIIAMDSFKGCLSSAEAAEATRKALTEVMPGAEISCMTVSDGGDGMLDAFAAAMGARIETARVHDPLMRIITARYGVCNDGTAIIETAEACGLTLMKPEELNPMRASTCGVGELIAAAVKRGCRRFIIGLGGSGTSDAGIGMLRTLTDMFTGGDGCIDEMMKGDMGNCVFTLACDVNNPLYGENGAAAVFGRQKGATPDMIPLLDRRAEKFAAMSARHCGHDCSSKPGAGAAGGLGYAFMQFFNTEIRNGADLMLDICNFDKAAKGADLIITGEGHADRQTLMNKMPARILERANTLGIPVWLLAGDVDNREELLAAGFERVEKITPGNMDTSKAMIPDVARENISATIRQMQSRCSC